MGVSNQTVLIMIAFAITYLLIYQKNRLVGNIIFLAISFVSLTIINIDGAIGFILICVSIINLVYDILTRWKKYTQLKRLNT